MGTDGTRTGSRHGGSVPYLGLCKGQVKGNEAGTKYQDRIDLHVNKCVIKPECVHASERDYFSAKFK